MKNYFEILLLFSMLIFLGCESKPSEASQAPVDATNSPSEATSTSPNPSKNIPQSFQTKQLPTKHECTAKGKLMEGNELFIPNEQLWACIVADDITRDSDFGDSYRILDVYDTKDCKRISRKVLPINNSPDFPWYIFEKTFEEKNKVLCTSGFEFTYCFDVENRSLLPQMAPKYLLPREAMDAQSGMPLGMRVYENYLFGCVRDFGFYAFDLSNKKAVKNFLPAAEYHLKAENVYHSFFLLPLNNNTYQAILPTIDQNTGAIAFTPLFQHPMQINPVIAKNVQNNRFQIFKNEDAKNDSRIAIDLLKKKQIALPAAVANKPVGVILDYLKKSDK